MAISFGKRYMLRHIARISIEFSPFDKSSGSARELYRQLLSPSMAGKHPNCQIDVKVLEGCPRECPPVVRVDYINGIQDVIECRRPPKEVAPGAEDFFAEEGGDAAGAGADGGAAHNSFAYDPSEPIGAEHWPDGSAERLALNPPPALSSDEIIKQITHRTDGAVSFAGRGGHARGW